MIEVKRVTVDLEIPSTEVNFVAMQPYVRLTDTEPFKWKASVCEIQLQAIDRALDIAGSQAHFTLFPEYSVPGLDGVDRIDSRIRSSSWKDNSVVVAGIDGLSKGEFELLCGTYDVEVAEGCRPERIECNQWVNCCMIWIKEGSGNVRSWLQLKVRPAWPEQNTAYQDMFCGSTVHLFESKFDNESICRFSTFICFDWVSKDSGTSVLDDTLRQLNILANDSGVELSLHWVFVIQHNPAPNDASFLTSTTRFLTDPNVAPSIKTDDAVVIHANTAVSEEPSSAINAAGAFSSCVLAPGTTIDDRGFRPTVCMQPTNLRGGKDHGACKDIVFREMGECIHQFKSRVPRFVTYSPADRSPLLTDARVFSVNDSMDPRTNGRAVPGAVKWGNDFLDAWVPLSEGALAHAAIKAEVANAECFVLENLRKCDGQAITEKLEYATSTPLDDNKERTFERTKNSDQWDKCEADAYAHMMHTVTSLSVPYDVDVITAEMHGSLVTDQYFVHLLAIKGKSHEDCRVHYDKLVPKNRTDGVLVVARDKENLTPATEEYQKYYEVSNDGLAFIDYPSLVKYCRESVDVDSLRNKIDAILPKPPTII